MLIYGEFGTIARLSEHLGLLINGGSVALEILPFMVGVSNLREMEFRSLNISAGSSSEDSCSASLDFRSWELCFSLVSPLWESCYSLAS